MSEVYDEDDDMLDENGRCTCGDPLCDDEPVNAPTPGQKVSDKLLTPPNVSDKIIT